MPVSPNAVLGDSDLRHGPVMPGGSVAASFGRFDPRKLTGLELWLDARHPSGIGVAVPADGTALQTWVDLSGNSRDATQATAGRRPTYESAGRNLIPSLDFSLSDTDQLGWTCPALALTAVSAYIVAELDADVSGSPATMVSCGSSSTMRLRLGTGENEHSRAEGPLHPQPAQFPSQRPSSCRASQARPMHSHSSTGSQAQQTPPTRRERPTPRARSGRLTGPNTSMAQSPPSWCSRRPTAPHNGNRLSDGSGNCSASPSHDREEKPWLTRL